MMTGVQLRRASDAVDAQLVGGRPNAMAEGKCGPVALFAPNHVVAYVVRAHCRRPRLFLFRTLEVDDRLAARVPGVHPHVRLLAQLSTMGRVELVRRFFRGLTSERDPADVPDAFYVRLGAALSGRSHAPDLVPALLQRIAMNDGEPSWTY